MPEYVRVKEVESGVHVSILAAQLAATPDAYQRLKQDAVDLNGDPLPVELPKSLSSSKAKGRTATDTTEEN